jgi:hypothetical protein
MQLLVESWRALEYISQDIEEGLGLRQGSMCCVVVQINFVFRQIQHVRSLYYKKRLWLKIRVILS